MADSVTRISQPAGASRIDSGAIQFEYDNWPGYFLRGDHCMSFVDKLDYVRNRQSDETCKKILTELRDRLSSCIVE